MNNEIIDLLVKSLSAELISKREDYIPTEERINQYRNVFTDFDSAYDKLKATTFFEKFEATFKRYTSDLLDTKELRKYQSKISIVPIESNQHSSIAYKYGNNSLVIIDIITMQFLWMMNKAFLLGFKDENNSIELFTKIFLHFGTLLNPDRFKLIFPRPKTPPHSSHQDISTLVFITEIQEKFLLAHEISHLIIAENKSLDSKSGLTSLLLDSIEEKDSSSIQLELAVDKMAIKMVIENLSKLYPEKVVDFGCENIFLLIRYFLWLYITINTDDKMPDRQFEFWLIRNSQLRDIFREEIGHDFLNVGIIEMLEYLELTMEPAAYAANDILKKVLASN